MKSLKIFIAVAFVFASFGLFAADYDHEIIEKGITFKWKIDGKDIHIFLSANTKGWIGIGFNPESEMKGANFIIGYVKKDGEVKVKDHYGYKNHDHKSDKKLGGKKNISNILGKEADGVTHISFTIPLDSGDAKDNPIQPDADTTLLLAYGTVDKIDAKHKVNTKLKVNLSTGKVSK